MTHLAAAIDAALGRIKPDEVLGLAQTLVRIPSVSGAEGSAISEAVADWLNAKGIPATLHEIAPGRVNVLGRLASGAPGPTLMLNGHLDTKPFEGMIIDPLGAEVRDGKLWGRGACDMKAPVAAAMVAAKALRDSGALTRGTLLIGCEVGEEGGGGPGGWTLPALIDGPGACDALICCEPTNLQLHIGCRGGFPLSITTYGRATHTAMAYTGVNAIEKMATVVTALYRLPAFLEDDPIWGRTPLNAEQIAGGGHVVASLPDRCDLRCDIRLNPNTPADRLERELSAMIAELQANDPDLRVEWSLRRPPIPARQIGADHPLLGAVRAGAAIGLGGAPRIGGFPGGCSAGFMLQRGTPAIVFGPGNLEQAHTVDEWIAIDQLGPAARTYAAAALTYLAA